MTRTPNERQQTGTRGNEREWGDRMNGGAVTGGARDGHVWVNAALLGVGVTTRLTPDQADAFADGLRRWAEQVRQAGSQ